MKRILLSICLVGAAAFGVSAQNSVNIKLKSGQTVTYAVSDIDEINFTDSDEKPMPKVVSIAVPEEFATGWVQKVMVNGKQVAEICKEYIKSVNKQMVVLYPCGEDGRAILTKGVSTTGATVVWDLAANTATVGTEGEAKSNFFLEDGAIVSSASEEGTAATIEADIIVDARGLERQTYKIVKIGTQYWMAENLRATYYLDGTPIPAINGEDTADWNANTDGCRLATTASDADWIKIAGHLYNAYVMGNEKGIAPEGWAVPTSDDMTKLKAAGNTKSIYFKSSTELMWATGGGGTNITGFNGVATGYYTTATGLSAVASDAYYWSQTNYYDSLSKATVWDFMRFTTSQTAGVSLSSVLKNGHLPNFGHSLRCIRK